MIRPLCLIVDYDHVEQVSPAGFHVSGRCNYVLKLVLLEFKHILDQSLSNILLYIQMKPTLNGSPLRIFFRRSFSRLGGATRTTYGFKSDERKSFRLCGCRLSTHIFPLATTARMASKEVPAMIGKLLVLDPSKHSYPYDPYHSTPFHIRHVPRICGPICPIQTVPGL